MNQEDKTILILLTTAVLLIFLDIQAKKQQEFIKNNVKKVSVKELVESSKEALNQVQKEEYINKVKTMIEQNIPTEEILKTISKIKSLMSSNQLEQLYQKNKELLTLPIDQKENTNLKLYYLRFRDDKTTEIQEITRKIKGKITPAVALQILQKGPQEGEPNLVNAFYTNISIKNISYDEETKTFHLFFSLSFLSANSNVQRDRILQICHTIKQFPNIKNLIIWIDENPYFFLDDCSKGYQKLQI
ncbi:MAG: GerMN domain-containing protein [Leptospiraceae bacterium]|nr:GerMN domain-containing protein [Leptospiraceae bacterium]MDW7975273.1 GerMN domain-containing protein [Leptospiraceae bacterium]